jgi:hypothetical protein
MHIVQRWAHIKDQNQDHGQRRQNQKQRKELAHG